MVQLMYSSSTPHVWFWYAFRMKGVREGTITENTSYYIFTQCADGAFEAFPVEEWYTFSPVIKYKYLNSEEAEEEFSRLNIIHLWSIHPFLTSSSSLSRWNLSSWRAMPLRVTIRAAPPHRLGRVSNFHCSVKTPALGDLKTNGNFMVSPGKITPWKNWESLF